MADALMWKEGEGYDVHLLRGGPASKRLIDSLAMGTRALTTSEAALVAFVPQFLGNVTDHGIEVDGNIGLVKALIHPSPTFPRLHNFLLSAVFPSGGATQEVLIRIHVHDSIDDIWLTPPTLTIHRDADECRLTVLARFSDQCVGDITDWSAPALILQSADEGVVNILAADRVLQAVAAAGQSDVTAMVTVADLNLTRTSAPVRVSVTKGWVDFAKEATVLFVTGKTAPDENNSDGSAPDSVKSVVEGATNILFVSEGFRQSQRGDFNNYVWIITDELRTKRYLLPFTLLKKSVNFWSVFVPSEDNGVTVLGDYVLMAPENAAYLLPFGKVPTAAATEWTRQEMLHQVGLPIQLDAETPWPANHVGRWQRLYQATVTEPLIRKYYLSWTAAAFRSVPDEKDTAFGMTIGDRPLASKGPRTFTFLEAAPGARRTSDASIATFIEALTFGKGTAANPAFNIGATWKVTGGKNAGLVCFVCLSDRIGGTQNPGRYFTASTGRTEVLDLLPVTGRPGRVVNTSPPEKHSRTVLASVVAHECGHALGLGDEYGDAAGTVAPVVPDNGNLVLKSSVATVTSHPTTGDQAVFNKTENIKWLWPRLRRGGVLAAKPEQSGTGFRVTLRPGHREIFKNGDIVQFREWPVKQAPGADPFRTSVPLSGHVFRVRGPDGAALLVDLTTADGIVVDVGTPSGGAGSQTWAQVVLGLFNASPVHALVCPQVKGEKELTLIADFMLEHIASKGPLTAEPGFDPGLCVAQPRINTVMSPTNLPAFSNAKKLILADVIGLYEGGGYHDCGVYRPAGRCKMRSASEKLMPFCHVCRYLIVDRIDPTKHGDLDAIYDKQYPRKSTG